MVPSQLLPIRLLLLSPAYPLRRALVLSHAPRAFSARPAAGGQPKSLVDEEAELSDWVTDLKMESRFRPAAAAAATRRPSGGRAGRRRRGDSDEDFGSLLDRRNGKSGETKGSGKRSLLGRDLDDSEENDNGDFEEEESYGGGWRRRRGRGRLSGSGSRSGRGDNGRRRGGLGMGSRFSSPGIKKGDRRLDTKWGVVRDDRKRLDFRSTEEEEDDGGEFGFASPAKKRGERRSDMDRPKGREQKRVSFESTEEDDDDEFGLVSMVARGRGRKLDTGKRKGLDRRGVSFELTGEDESDESDDELGIEDGLFSEGEGGGESVEKGAVGSLNSYQGVAAGESSEWKKRSLGGESDSYLSNSRFDECPLSPLSLKGVNAAGFERMTVVQEATLPVILRGKDVLAKAKTGTGKTVAFLLPAIEVVAKQPPIDRDQRRPPIYVLVICPTRELANQAAMEADKLLKFHPNIGAQCVTGGIRLALEQKRLQANPCQILVATPGRLRDHIENTAGFATRLRGVKVLVLDEADHLLDMGFRKDIEQIIAAVPKQRQTLLFSATIPEEVRQICHIALRRDHEYINIVEEGSEETHSQVRQNFLIVSLERQFSVLYCLLNDHIADDADYKVLVFCTTAMVTRLVAEFLSEMKLNVREIHSRKTQSYRSKVSTEFRKSKGLILVTSDVSARGVDYPDVTLVIQLGVPSGREQYIHRLGRTGRKGKEGQGILMLAPWEEYFLSSIRDLPITKVPLHSVDPDTTRKVQHALAYVQMKDKESAYQAWLGYYNSNKMIGRDKSRVVELANEFSRSMGLENPPAIPKLVLGKMGLRNVPGLRSK